MSLIETQRLSVRPLQAEDASFVLRLLNEASFHRHIGDRGVQDLAAARDYIARSATPCVEGGFGMCRVARKEDDEPVGICGLVQRAGVGDVEIGYAMLERYTGRGYAVESAAAVLRQALGPLGLPRVVAITRPDNPASISVLRRVGLVFERWLALPDREYALYAIEAGRSDPAPA
ncbi:GNAT family N-acetyltransferase [Eleftheria terrae]|uniref:GNAT family N-acetyltransferase n=1 Tax=Eleftheria terrae TaxID=1597781 RepID=UPI00263B5A6A|nr:GNAT family N-acetyltransferase [Eleftheria terrae]WKB55553.1 GNAT family N-acetyltransferase [Eleftheria terrae]